MTRRNCWVIWLALFGDQPTQVSTFVTNMSLGDKSIDFGKEALVRELLVSGL